MDFRITKEYVWSGIIPDRPGAMAEKLQALHAGGLDLELIIGRRDWSGNGMLFVSPLRTVEEIEAAEKAGLAMTDSFLALRIEGPNVPGVAARIATALAEANLSLHAYNAAALGDKHVTMIHLDSKEEVDRAKEVLEQALSS
ncbi:MAG: ACT domain-containing protein [Planctomycetota bacterium]